MVFEWDPAKAEANLRKHGLSFEEATELLAGISAREATRREVLFFREHEASGHE